MLVRIPPKYSVADQISLMEYIDPFTGEPIKKAKIKPLSGSLKNSAIGRSFYALTGAAGIYTLIGLVQATG